MNSWTVRNSKGLFSWVFTKTKNFKQEIKRTHGYVNIKEVLMLCYVMLCILYLKWCIKFIIKTNKYWLIDASRTPGDQMWCLAAVIAAATYSDEVQATATTATTKNNAVQVWE